MIGLLPMDAAGVRNYIGAKLMESAEVKRRAAEACLDEIRRAVDLVATSFKNGGKLLLCGNGGSAADCQHIATEFVSSFDKNLIRPALPAIALTTDTSFLTANANDFGIEGVFARQVEALGRSGDVLIAISTSGNSANVVRAVEMAGSLKMTTIGFTGASESKLADLADVAIQVPSDDTQHIQEAHIAIGHILCGLVEQIIYNKNS